LQSRCHEDRMLAGELHRAIVDKQLGVGRQIDDQFGLLGGGAFLLDFFGRFHDFFRRFARHHGRRHRDRGVVAVATADTAGIRDHPKATSITTAITAMATDVSTSIATTASVAAIASAVPVAPVAAMALPPPAM